MNETCMFLIWISLSTETALNTLQLSLQMRAFCFYMVVHTPRYQLQPWLCSSSNPIVFTVVRIRKEFGFSSSIHHNSMNYYNACPWLDLQVWFHWLWCVDAKTGKVGRKICFSFGKYGCSMPSCHISPVLQAKRADPEVDAWQEQLLHSNCLQSSSLLKHKQHKTTYCLPTGVLIWWMLQNKSLLIGSDFIVPGSWKGGRGDWNERPKSHPFFRLLAAV